MGIAHNCYTFNVLISKARSMIFSVFSPYTLTRIVSSRSTQCVTPTSLFVIPLLKTFKRVDKKNKIFSSNSDQNVINTLYLMFSVDQQGRNTETTFEISGMRLHLSIKTFNSTQSDDEGTSILCSRNDITTTICSLKLNL